MSPRWIRSLALAALCCRGAAPPEASTLFAPPPGRLAFQAYGLEHGLSSLAVWCIQQDREGLIWVGTENGLLRFDGRGFETFGRREGLPTSSVNALHEDPSGRLWVGTTQGLAWREGGAFRSFPAGQGLPRLYVNALGSASDGSLWVATPEGPWRRSPGGDFAPAPGWPGGQATALCAGGGTVAAAAWSGSGAKLLQASGGGWAEVPAEGDFGREPVDALARDGAGTLWARTLGGLWRLEGGRLRRAPFPVPRTHQKGALHVDPKGRLWVVTEAGLLRVEGDRTELIGPQDGLPPNRYRTVAVDREGTLWAGGTGLFRERGAGAWRASGLEEALPSVNIWCVFRDRAGRLHVGTDQGLSRAEGGRWAPVPGTAAMQVRSVVEAPDGTLLMAGSPWILRLDPRTGRAERLGAESGLRSGRRIFRLCLDREGTLWVATEGEGLFRGSLREGRWSFVREPLPGTEGKETFEDVCQDAQGRIWAPGERGLAMRENGSWRRFGAAEGLRDPHLTHARPTRAGELLVSYAGGLGLFRARWEGGKFEVLEHLDGVLPTGQVIYMAAEDHRGRTWIGTGAGVYLLEPDGAGGRRLARFTTADGLAGDDVNSQAFLSDPDGAVWIGTSSGLARFDAGDRPAVPEPPRTAILGFRLGDRAFAEVPAEAPRTPRRQGSFEARFAGLSTRHGETLEFEVRLLGLDPEWHPAPQQRERFLSLGAGAYAFQVRARHPGGAWGPEARAAFEVLPAWWQTWWAETLYALAALGAVALAHRLRVRILRQRNRELQARVREATAELLAREQEVERQALDLARANDELQALNAQKDQFMGIAAHDLRNPLSAIGMAAHLLEQSTDPEDVAWAAASIRQEAQEMGALIGRFLDLAAIEAGSIRADPEAFDPAATVRDLVRRHAPRAGEKRIALEAELPEGPVRAWADPRFTKEVLDNLVSNALKFSESGTTVRLRLEPRPGTVRFSVEDQGPGLTPEDKEKLFGRFARLSGKPTAGEKSTGLGLSIVKLMVDAMGGRIWVDSEPGKGAAFRVELPDQPPAAGSTA